MPDLRFTISGPPRTKKNSPRPGHRPSGAFAAWEESAIPALRHLRKSAPPGLLPLSCPCTLDITVYVKGPEGDAFGYGQAVGDLLDATRAKFAHKKKERQLKVSLPFSCDYQIVTDDKLFNLGASVRVLRDKDNPRIEVKITW